MSRSRLRLAFVSPLFLFPTDAGGKIRTANILRGLKGGAFDVTLLSPASSEPAERWAREIETVCDRFVAWPASRARPKALRALDLLGRLPVNVAADRSASGAAAVSKVVREGGVDLVVFDFVHAAVLRPERLDCASICFTHNVEAEIFQRHALDAANPLMRLVWRAQHAKMTQFEARALACFDGVVAVSRRDADFFRRDYGIAHVGDIPTGVDLDFFSWQGPAASGGAPTVVFTGSMDSAANIGGVQFFLDEVWPLVRADRPDARFVVVGRKPPASLVARAQREPGLEVTGSVEDVRPHVGRGHVFVIPLRVGGGTRIKAFEAMAMGCPVVSTSLGIEGLGLTEGEHYVGRDDAAGMASAITELLGDAAMRERLARSARGLVEAKFGHRAAAEVFERLCIETVERVRSRVLTS